MSHASTPRDQARALAAELYAVLKGRSLSYGLVLAALELLRDHIVKRCAAHGHKDPALIDMAERSRQATKPSAEVLDRIQRIKKGV